MAVYFYRQDDVDQLRAERIGLFGTHEGDVESERHQLVNAGMNAALKREAVAQEVTGLLARSHSTRLPVEFLSRLIAGGHYDVQVADESSGLAMRPSDEAGAPNFIVATEEVADTEELLGIAAGQADPATFDRRFLDRVITHSAVQYQIFQSERVLHFREHESFGRIGADGYEPLVTVLGPEHPVAQAVEQITA